MKKLFTILVATLLLIAITGCDTSQDKTVDTAPQTTTDNDSPQITETQEPEIGIHQLKSGDAVSIVGQKASSALVNENTMWVQVQQNDGSFVIYHCQMKDEYLKEAEDIAMLSVVKVSGVFQSLMDLEQENTSPLVTLYECEIVS